MGKMNLQCESIAIFLDGNHLKVELTNASPAPLWTKDDCAKFLNVTPRSIENYIKRPRNPLPVDTGSVAMGLLRFDEMKVRDWAKGRKK